MDRKNVSTNLFWRLLERFGAQGVTFLVSLVLARVLGPEAYGTLALITVITALLQVFVDSGLGTALIQKKNADDTDFSSVFYVNMGLCLVIYLGLFFAAPLVTRFYGKDVEFTWMVRTVGLILIISGMKNVQHAYCARNLLFKKYFFATLGGTLTAAVVGIVMAYAGFGVWALIAQNLVNQTIDTVILWITVGWKPKKLFSWQRMKGLFSFGWKMLVSSLLNTLWLELRQLIIGKMYSSADLAYYNKGAEYPKDATVSITSTVDSVMLPVMAKEQDDPKKVKAITRRAIKVGSYIIWPMMVGLAVCSKQVIGLILGQAWLPAVPYLQIFCIVYAFYPIHTANLNAIKAMGRSDLFLILEIIKKIVSLVTILATMWFGVIWLAIGSLAGSLVNQFVNAFPNSKLLGYNYLEQWKDLTSSFFLSAGMGAIVYCVNFLGLPDLPTLLIQVPLGVLLYVVGSIVFKFESFHYVKDLILSYFKKKR